jgi:hypothetical protein
LLDFGAGARRLPFDSGQAFSKTGNERTAVRGCDAGPVKNGPNARILGIIRVTR